MQYCDICLEEVTCLRVNSALQWQLTEGSDCLGGCIVSYSDSCSEEGTVNEIFNAFQ